MLYWVGINQKRLLSQKFKGPLFRRVFRLQWDNVIYEKNNFSNWEDLEL